MTSPEIVLPLVSKSLRYLEALLELQKLEEEYLRNTKYFDHVRKEADRDYFFTAKAISNHIKRSWEEQRIICTMDNYQSQGLIEKVRISLDCEPRRNRFIVEGYRISRLKMDEIQKMINQCSRDWPID